MSFPHPPSSSLTSLGKLRLWATHYHIFQAPAIPVNRDSVEPLGAGNAPLGVRLTKRKLQKHHRLHVDGGGGDQTWCKALMLGLPAAIPEPSTAILSLLASSALLKRRRRHPAM